MIVRIFLVVVLSLFFCITDSMAQHPVLDIREIRVDLKKAVSDTSQSRLKAMLGWEIRYSNQKEAESLANEVIEIALKSNDNLRLAEAYRILGFIKIINQDLQGGLDMYAIGTTYAEKAQSAYYKASFLNLSANMFHDKGDFDKSIQLYSQGLKIAEAADEPVMVAMLTNNIAEAYADAGRNISFTLPFYEKALQKVVQSAYWQFAGMIYSNIAKENLRAGNRKEASEAIEHSLENLNKKKDRAFVYASTITDLGETLFGLGKNEESEQYLLDAQFIFDSLQRKDDLVKPISVLAELYLKTGRLNKAESYGAILLEKATELKSKLYLRNANWILSEVARKKGKPEQALKYYSLFKEWNDSIFNEQKEKAIVNAESIMNLDRRARENQLLKESYANLVKSVVMAVITALVLLIAGILLIKGYRNIKKKNNLLYQQKQLIEKESVEKDILIREIHHRVKNNLQVVSSLLNLKANSITDAKAVEALRDSHQKVRAISLIHQKLYGFENLSAIPIKEYILQLFSDMRILYKGNHINLTCITKPDGLLLDLECAVPLGLILNEAITNAMKHAFVNMESGSIKIECFEQEDGYIHFSVSDNGHGFPVAFDPKNNLSLGFRIIRELTRQLKGVFSINSINQGASFSIIFPNGIKKERIA